MKRNKAVLIFVLLILLLSGCRIIDKFRKPKDVLLLDLYVFFDKGLDLEAFEYANQRAWYTVSSYMFRDLQKKLQHINFKKIVYIENQDEYIPAGNSYLLIINFCNYYITGRHKTINVDYKLIHNTNILIDKSRDHGYRNWQKNARCFNEKIVRYVMKVIYKNSQPFIISQ